MWCFSKWFGTEGLRALLLTFLLGCSGSSRREPAAQQQARETSLVQASGQESLVARESPGLSENIAQNFSQDRSLPQRVPSSAPLACITPPSAEFHVEPEAAPKFRYTRVTLRYLRGKPSASRKRSVGNFSDPGGMKVKILRAYHKHRAPDKIPVWFVDLLVEYQGDRVKMNWKLEHRESSTKWRRIRRKGPLSDWRARIVSSAHSHRYVFAFGKKSSTEI